MARPGGHRPYEVVLSGAIQLLAATNRHRQHRTKEERPLANVYAPRCHLHPHVLELRISLDQSWELDPMFNGHSGHDLCGKHAYPNNLPCP